MTLFRYIKPPFDYAMLTKLYSKVVLDTPCLTVPVASKFFTGVTPVRKFSTGVTPVRKFSTGVTPVRKFSAGVTPVRIFPTGVTPVCKILTGVTPVRKLLTRVTWSVRRRNSPIKYRSLMKLTSRSFVDPMIFYY